MKGLSFALALFLAVGCAGPSSTSAPVSLDPGALLALDGADLDGNVVALRSLVNEGKPAAVIFWQTWCKPCLAKTPQLAADARTWGDRIAFVGVVSGGDSTVREDEVKRIVSEHSVPYPQVRDRDLSWARAFGIEGTPTIVVIDGEGAVRYRGNQLPPDWGAVLRP